MTPCSPTLTAVRPRAAALATALALAAAGWIIVVWHTDSMDMGVATQLGPFPGFLGGWAVMMAAMMLPGAVPALLRRVEQTGRVRTIAAFLAGYLGVWTLAGVAVYAGYRPHTTVVAGLLAIAAGAYELSPAKRYFRQCCQDGGGSGLRFGLFCVGSSIGLTVLFVAIGPMSIAWMVAVALLSLAQKLYPPKPSADIPVALAMIGLGFVILLAPHWVPGLTPTM